jgi:hypothetical protein
VLARVRARPGRALTVQEGDELLPRSLRAQGKSYRVEAVDGVQAQDDIVVLQFVDEHGDWVELVVLVRFHGGRSISGDGEGVGGWRPSVWARVVEARGVAESRWR